MPDPILNVHQVAERTGQSAQTVRRLALEGAIPAWKAGERTSPYRFRESDVESWIRAQIARQRRRITGHS